MSSVCGGMKKQQNHDNKIGSPQSHWMDWHQYCPTRQQLKQKFMLQVQANLKQNLKQKFKQSSNSKIKSYKSTTKCGSADLLPLHSLFLRIRQLLLPNLFPNFLFPVLRLLVHFHVVFQPQCFQICYNCINLSHSQHNIINIHNEQYQWFGTVETR